jgi:hypothetical protein
MKLGKNKNIYLIICFVLYFLPVNSEQKISTIPLINLENLKPSFEEEEINSAEILKQETKIKEKIKKRRKSKQVSVNIVGLDKITAKTSKINIKIGETKSLGFLEIKAIKCGKVNSITEPGEVAYIQVRDLSKRQIDKVFVFNGWTFSSNPSLKPIDHPVYDLWLESCENV